MKLPFSVFLALRYLRPKRTFLSVVTAISILGVVLGVAILVIVLSVMSGFDEMWREKILGFESHITIEGAGVIMETDALMERVEQVDGAMGAAPYVQTLVFMQVGDRISTPIVRGVDADRERAISRVPQHMIEGSFSVGFDEAVIGADLARQAGLGVGDRILLYSPQSFANPDELVLPEELEITGIFELGMWEFDVGFVITSLETAQDLCGLDRGVHAIQIMTRDPLHLQSVKQAVQEAAGLRYLVRTWEERNRTLFAALRVEKNVMFILLMFITLVAAFSICNTLITETVQKTREIGLLKALGFNAGEIMRVFLWQGWIQGILGTVFGLATALLFLRYRNGILAFLNQRFGYEVLPKSLYHLNEIPASTSVSDLVVVAASVMVICTFASLIPAYRAARLEPARALRYE